MTLEFFLLSSSEVGSRLFYGLGAVIKRRLVMCIDLIIRKERQEQYYWYRNRHFFPRLSPNDSITAPFGEEGAPPCASSSRNFSISHRSFLFLIFWKYPIKNQSIRPPVMVYIFSSFFSYRQSIFRNHCFNFFHRETERV